MRDARSIHGGNAGNGSRKRSPSPLGTSADATWSHVWIGRKFLPNRHGQLCRILVAWRGKFELEFADGWRTVTVRGTFRRFASSR